MPVFFFNLDAGRDKITDRDGAQLPDLRAARAYAITVARELMNRKEIERRHWRLAVLDSQGHQVVTIPFAKVDPMLDHLSPSLRQAVEQLAETRHDLAETVSEMDRLRIQLRAVGARSSRQPYLIAQNGRQI